MGANNYVGRFAPSPTGPLHFGSLVAALASYLDARHHHGDWLLRIEDLDPPREDPASPDEIMAQLRAFGMRWDGDVLFQGTRLDAYETLLSRLTQSGITYRCTCSRKSWGAVYPGTCRDASVTGDDKLYAIRVRGPDGRLSFEDRLYGTVTYDWAADIGDFVIRRKDNLFAYQLAVVADDDFQGVNQVVRGADLLDSTPRQLVLYSALGLSPPAYLHIPVITDPDGHKLSKQSFSPAVTTIDVLAELRRALSMLGQNVQTGAHNKEDLLELASRDWRPEAITRTQSIVER